MKRWEKTLRYSFVAVITGVLATATVIGGYSVIDGIHARQDQERLAQTTRDRNVELQGELKSLNEKLGALSEQLRDNGITPATSVSPSSTVPAPTATGSAAGPAPHSSVAGAGPALPSARPTVRRTPKPSPSPTPSMTPTPPALLCVLLKPLGGTC